MAKLSADHFCVASHYLAREGASRDLVYVGMAGERSGTGIRGRLARYASGKAIASGLGEAVFDRALAVKAIASGLGEAVFDRALADLSWLRARLAEAECGQPKRATQWGRLSFERADLHICWAITADGAAARSLEEQVLALSRISRSGTA